MKVIAKEKAKRKYDGHIVLKYSAPTAITCGSLEKIEIILLGKKIAIATKIRETRRGPCADHSAGSGPPAPDWGPGDPRFRGGVVIIARVIRHV